MELFFCQAQGSSMTREGCGNLWKKAETLRSEGASLMGAQLMQCKMCLDCPLGKAHHAGEKPTEWPPRDREHWPKGPITIREVNVRPFATEPPKKPAPSTELPKPELVKPKTALRILPQDMDRPVGPRPQDTVPPRSLPPSPAAPKVTPPSPQAPTATPPSPVAPIERVRPPVKRPGAGRPAALYTYCGEVLTAVQWCKRNEIKLLGINPALMRMRRNKGWDDAKILSTPANAKAAGRAEPAVDFGNLSPNTIQAINDAITSFLLSPRESDVLTAIVRNIPRHELASAMGISENTIKRLVNRMVQKMGVRDSQAAAKYVLTKAVRMTHPIKEQTMPDPSPQMPESPVQERRLNIYTTGQVLDSKSEMAREARTEVDDELIVEDLEIAAMARIARALRKLSDEERRRVLAWMTMRYGSTS